MEEALYLPPFDECPSPNHCLVMNIIAWNCRGALKPSFQNHVRDLVHNHDPAIMIIMGTRIGGDRYYRILSNLLVVCGFYGIMIECISLNWPQEIHVLVKVTSSNFEFICTVIYASPKFHEHCILWNNLKNVANLHNKP